MKTQQECWEAMFAGETLVSIGTGNEFRVVNGTLVDASGTSRSISFDAPGNWRIKPRVLPFAEALRELVIGRCESITSCGFVINRGAVVGDLNDACFNVDWELVK